MEKAEEKFDKSVFFVLNKIMSEALPDNFSKIRYLFDLDITRQRPISYKDEKKALEFLIDYKVIEEIAEKDVVEIGKKGTTKYKAYHSYTFATTKRFFAFYDRYSLKVSRVNTKSYRTIKRRLIQNLIESKFRGEYEKKLILLLSKDDKTASQLQAEIGVKNIYHLIKNTRKKLQATPFKIEGIKSGTFREYKKFRLTIS